MELVPTTFEQEVKKHPELTKNTMDNMREWIRKRPYLPEISDLKIALFLHSCYFSVEKAKQTIDTYYTLRTHVPEYFSNRDPAHPTVANAMDVVTYVVLPELTDNGSKVIISCLNNTDPSQYNLGNVLKYFSHIEDMALYECGSEKGIDVVFDMASVTFAHLTRMNIISIKKYLYYLQEAMPVRLKGLHYINVVSFMDKIVALMRPFMKQELMQMLHIHADGMDSLFRYIPQRIMPAEYGGMAPSIKILREQTVNKILANAKFFIDEEKYRVNEALRPGKAKNAGEIFGAEGSFKKLDID